MDNLVRCKACGYVTDQKNVKDVCPACGVPAKMFEPYKHPVSLKRRRWMDLHTHPVLVHFPQGYALTLFLLSFIAFFAPSGVTGTISSTISVLSALLPFFVLGAIATGLFDGKLRFRKVTTPHLKKKLILSLLFFIVSVFMAYLALSGNVLASPAHILFTLLALIISLCGALLGLVGGRLLDAKFPG